MGLLLKGIVRFLTALLSPIVEEFLKLSVARGIVISFGMSIIIGSFILYIFENGNLSYINSLYLSASAFCVTGLTPIPISSLGIHTQILLLFFIQMGGLGIIVVTVLIGLLVINNLSRNTKLHDFITEVIDVDT
ncbi:MAG: potassium transporter Trk, partial [Spirochaetia bacterium]|nr:potassium transporter Trk [Spirochaetia bacterium]